MSGESQEEGKNKTKQNTRIFIFTGQCPEQHSRQPLALDVFTMDPPGAGGQGL